MIVVSVIELAIPPHSCPSCSKIASLYKPIKVPPPPLTKLAAPFAPVISKKLLTKNTSLIRHLFDVLTKSALLEL